MLSLYTSACLSVSEGKKELSPFQCLSNANPVSTWMGERLTLAKAVDFFGYFCFLLSVPAVLFSPVIMEKSKNSHTEYDVP